MDAKNYSYAGYNTDGNNTITQVRDASPAETAGMQLVDDDEKWRQILRGLNKDFYHQTVSSAEIEQYLIAKTGIELSSIFDQYLRTTMIPKLEYGHDEGIFKYRYTNVVPGFKMPIRLLVGETLKWVTPSTEWQTVAIESDLSALSVDKNFYIEVLKTN